MRDVGMLRPVWTLGLFLLSLQHKENQPTNTQGRSSRSASLLITIGKSSSFILI
ncbi:hypothetical protein LINPERHAP2_LOCUS5677 [Linum perenne]